MSAMQAAAFYIALNLIILLVLSVGVFMRRRSLKINLGDNGDMRMLQAIRAHANAAEWLPGALVGLVVLALLDAHVLIIHATGAALTVGRGLHAWGLSQSPGESFGRMTGTTLTMLVYLALAGVLLQRAFA